MSGPPAPLQGPEKSGQHSADFGAPLKDWLQLLVIEVTHPSSDYEMRLELHERAVRDGERVEVIAQVLAPMTFSDVRGNGHRSTAKL